MGWIDKVKDTIAGGDYEEVKEKHERQREEKHEKKMKHLKRKQELAAERAKLSELRKQTEENNLSISERRLKLSQQRQKNLPMFGGFTTASGHTRKPSLNPPLWSPNNAQEPPFLAVSRPKSKGKIKHKKHKRKTTRK